MAELSANYAKRLWDAWKDYEKLHGALSGVQLASRVETRIGRAFDDTKLSKIRQGKRRATVDEHYALAAELEIDADHLAGQKKPRMSNQESRTGLPIEEGVEKPLERPMRAKRKRA